MSVFSNASPEEIAGARAAVKPDQLAQWDAAAKAEGIALPTEAPAAEIAHLYRSHGVELSARPTVYHLTFREPAAMKPEDFAAARTWGSQMRMSQGQVQGLIDRVEQLAPELSKLAPADLAERQAKAQQFMGAERYTEALGKAREALKAGGDLPKFMASADTVLASDPYLLSTLARWQDNVASLNAKLADRAKK